MKKQIETQNAPAAIGAYSQAIQAGQTIYLSGQIPLDPQTMVLVSGDLLMQTERVIKNLKEVAEAAGGSLNHIVKLSVYLIDLTHMPMINEVITKHFKMPYPARTSIQVAALPKGAEVEIDAIMILA